MISEADRELKRNQYPIAFASFDPSAVRVNAKQSTRLVVRPSYDINRKRIAARCGEDWPLLDSNALKANSRVSSRQVGPVLGCQTADRVDQFKTAGNRPCISRFGSG